MIDNYNIYNRKMLLTELLFIEYQLSNRGKLEGTKSKLQEFDAQICWTTGASTKIYFAEILNRQSETMKQWTEQVTGSKMACIPYGWVVHKQKINGHNLGNQMKPLFAKILEITMWYASRN
jgi:hypothetical protein